MSLASNVGEFALAGAPSDGAERKVVAFGQECAGGLSRTDRAFLLSSYLSSESTKNKTFTLGRRVQNHSAAVDGFVVSIKA